MYYGSLGGRGGGGEGVGQGLTSDGQGCKDQCNPREALSFTLSEN